jgi:hypothetical protein
MIIMIIIGMITNDYNDYKRNEKYIKDLSLYYS